MEVPTHVYVGDSATTQTRIYHVRNCSGRMSEKNKIAATEENLALLKQLGYSVCRTCHFRYEKEQKAKEHADILEALEIASWPIPPEFELRVYWHRGKGNPVEIWSSKR